jgi:hypothetical protein
MDFGFLGYMGIMTLCLFCCPPAITAVAVVIAIDLNQRKVIAVSNQQIWLWGIIFFVLAVIITCTFVQIASNGVYAM